MYQRGVFEENRRRILEALFQQPMDFTSLRDVTGLSEPTLSRHIHHLLQPRFVEVKNKGKRRVYEITEKGLEELYPYLLGVNSALRAMKNEDIEKGIGRSFLSILGVRGAVSTYTSCLSRYNPPKEVKGSSKQLFSSIVEEMKDDFEELRRMKGIVQTVEDRGGDAVKIREELGEKLEKLNAIYYALGPPFSYMWKSMVESSDILGFAEF